MTIAHLIPRKWILMSLLISVQSLAQVTNEVVSYDYWFNNDYANKISTNISTPSETFELNENIATNGLPYGINTFNIHFKDNSNLWSEVLSEIFYKVPQSNLANGKIVAYEYWYNNNVASRVSEVVTATEQLNVVRSVDASTLENGINTFNIRFKDDSDLWSGVLSEIFYKVPQSNLATGKIVAYEYWYNNNVSSRLVEVETATRQLNLVRTVDASTLENGINTFNIRFKDGSNLWSGVLSEIFYKINPDDVIDNKIVSYRYWVDDAFDEKTEVILPVAISPLELGVLNLTKVWAGSYTINLQFKDTRGLWSGILKEDFIKNRLTIADFIVEETEICFGSAFSFTNESTDYDTLLWNFGDGNTSTDVNLVYTYATFGEFEVSLTVTNSRSGENDTISKKVKVLELPSKEVTSNTTFPATCNDTTVTLTAIADGTYLWSNGETTKSINPISTGEYSVTITNALNCTITSDKIKVSFKNEIDNTVTLNVATIEASFSGAKYQWIDCNNGNEIIVGATLQSYSPTIAGSYAVEITVDECTVLSECTNITDIDSDGILDALDNCPEISNADQADFDADGEGDVCDTDDDNDGVLDIDDACANTPVGEVVDEQGCTDIQLDVDDWELTKVIYYPNPTENIVYVKGLLSEKINLKVYALNGSLLFENSYVVFKGIIEFNLKNLPTGIFLVQVNGNKENIEFKIFKK